MSKIVCMDDNELYQKLTNGLAIPKSFVENYKTRQALYATIYSFSPEEQKTILLRYDIGFSVEEITELTKNSPIYVICILVLYLERLKLKLIAFNPTTKDAVSIEKLFEVELWEQYKAFLLECEKDPEYKIQFERTKEAFSGIFSDKVAGDFE